MVIHDAEGTYKSTHARQFDYGYHCAEFNDLN